MNHEISRENKTIKKTKILKVLDNLNNRQFTNLNSGVSLFPLQFVYS